MQIGQAQVVRSDRFDRSISNPVTFFASNLAPHGLTTRITYIVPANRVAKISAVLMDIYRNAPAAPMGTPFIIFTVNNPTPVPLINRAVYHTGNVAGDYAKSDIDIDTLYVAGTIITMKTSDDSTGGNLLMSMSFAITEYDA